MNIIGKILEGAVMSLFDIMIGPALEEEDRLLERTKARIERINVDRRKRGEPDLIVVGDSYPPSIITSDQLTERSEDKGVDGLGVCKEDHAILSMFTK